MNKVSSIFEPKDVALVGSSTIRENVGMASPQLFKNVTYNMKRFFHGKIYILDVDAHSDDISRRLRTVPELAVLMLPPDRSIVEAEKCARLGIRAFIVITGGYKKNQRQKLASLREKYGARFLGPNTIMGVINTSNGLNTTFEKDVMPRKGNIAVVSQSGGVGACMLDWACSYDVGISKFAFVGDKLDIDDVDLLKYLGNDKDTKVICMYIEGVKDGRALVEQARKIAEEKPILALKGGTTQESAQRAKSHTASIAGTDEVFDAAFKKAGIIRVGNIEELMNMAIALSKQPPMLGDRVAVVSNVGGPAILAADAVARSGLKLAKLSDKTRSKIENLFPGVDATNPVDMIADAKADRYEKVLDLVLSDRNVDAALLINMLKSTFFEPKDARIIPKIASKYPSKPIVDVPAGGEDFQKVHQIMATTNIPLYNLPEKAAEALKVLRTYSKIATKLRQSRATIT